MAPRWLYTDKRPPNGIEQVHTAHFSGDELLDLPRALHDRVDALLAEARAAAQKTGLNVWRIGEIRIRWRAGRAVSPMDYAMIDSGDWKDDDVPHVEDLEDGTRRSVKR